MMSEKNKGLVLAMWLTAVAFGALGLWWSEWSLLAAAIAAATAGSWRATDP